MPSQPFHAPFDTTQGARGRKASQKGSMSPVERHEQRSFRFLLGLSQGGEFMAIEGRGFFQVNWYVGGESQCSHAGVGGFRGEDHHGVYVGRLQEVFRTSVRSCFRECTARQLGVEAVQIAHSSHGDFVCQRQKDRRINVLENTSASEDTEPDSAGWPTGREIRGS